MPLAALDILISVINGRVGRVVFGSRALEACGRGGEGVALAFSGVKVIVEDHMEELPDDVSGEVISAVARLAQRGWTHPSRRRWRGPCRIISAVR